MAVVCRSPPRNANESIYRCHSGSTWHRTWIILADQLNRGQRRKTGQVLLAIGALTTIPLVINVVAIHLCVESAVLDGEIACIGWPVFRDLLFRRRRYVFMAFDLLYLKGKDLRTLPLVERKAALKKLLRRKRFTNPVPGSHRK